VIFDSLGIAASSLKAQQKAMDVVSHNIANVNTPGYSRQKGNISPLIPDQVAGLNIGRGVELNNISRVVDPIVNQAMLKNGSQQAFWQNIQSGLNSVESSFGSLQSTGLSAAIDDFFLSIQAMANNPQDLAQKANVRNKSETLTMQLSNMSQQLQSAQAAADAKIDNDIQSANTILDHIASLNVQIKQQESSAQGITGQANDLRDQRDQAIRDLSVLIPIQEVRTNDNGVLLQSMGGDLLVQDNISNHLARGANSQGFGSIVLAGSNAIVTGLKQGGSIGGSMTLRDDKLGGYLKDLDSLARNLAFGINQVQASGVGSSRTSKMLSGLGVSSPALSVDNVAQSNPYIGQIQSGSFTMHVYDATGAVVGKASIAITAGVSTMASIATDISSNVPGVTASVDSAGRLVIDAGSNNMGFSGDSSNFLAAYQINSIFQGASAAGMKLSSEVAANAGVIATGRIDATTSAIQTGDNTAALAMMAVQNTKVSFDGSTANSLSTRTSLLSSNYGNDVALAAQQSQFHKAESESLRQQREAFSGVNMDEELVTMIKFQRAYEASAKVIQTSNQMMNALLGLIR